MVWLALGAAYSVAYVVLGAYLRPGILLLSEPQAMRAAPRGGGTLTATTVCDEGMVSRRRVDAAAIIAFTSHT
jgi:hypothetical protein